MGNIVHVGQSARHEDIALASFGQYGIRRHLEVFGEKNVFVGGAKAGKSESGHLVTCPARIKKKKRYQLDSSTFDSYLSYIHNGAQYSGQSP